MKNVLVGAGLLAIGVFTITVHEKQVETIEAQQARISSLETKLESRDQYVSEQNKTLQRQREKLTESIKRNEQLEKQNKQLEKRLDALLHIEATAYTPKCDTGCIGITKTGLDVENTSFHEGKRIIAVDPKVIPLGTTVKVHTKDGSFLAVAEDTGGDIKGNRIDVLFQSERSADKFGRQEVVVEIM